MRSPSTMTLSQLIMELVQRTNQVQNGDGSMHKRQHELAQELNIRERRYMGC